jgi:hypothetical protein
MSWKGCGRRFSRRNIKVVALAWKMERLGKKNEKPQLE